MLLFCAQQLLGLKKVNLLHLSLDKAGPFTLESHICVKALKCKVFQITRCLIKPLLKNNIQTIFPGGTSWVAQLLNNVNVWMEFFCAQQLLGLKKVKNLLHLSLGKAGPFTLESHICVKALKCKVVQIIRCLIKPLLKKTTSKQFFNGVTHEWLSYSIIWMFGWYSFVSNNFCGWKNKNHFPSFLWVKLVHFFLESHICVKALKCKVFQIIRCLLKPFKKNNIQTIFQGGTSWVAQLLNNMNVWMLLFCAQQLLGLKKVNLLHLSLSKAGPSTLESHICVKALKCKVFQIIRCLIKPLLKNNIHTIFQGGTPWVAQLLNNMNVWMVLFCAQLLGLKIKGPDNPTCQLSSNKQQKKSKDGMGKARKGKEMVKDWCGASCVWKSKYE